MACASCGGSLVEGARFCPHCGERVLAEAPARDETRAILEKALGAQYRVERLLGRGGMGAVYLAHDPFLQRDVAVKVLPPERGAAAGSRERFLREARTAARLFHPNIVPLHSFGISEETLYYVMGYVKGESLAQRLHRDGKLPLEETRRILLDLADALDYAHRQGVVHRDIKPDNVLVEEGSGRVLLTDFGIAKALGAGQTLTTQGALIGTPQYMSPEQAQGRGNVDGRSDLYSLGVMGYAMVSGRTPFEGETPADVLVQHITREAPSLRTLAEGVPQGMALALERCLAKDPARRWATGDALKRALERELSEAMPEKLREARRLTGFLATSLAASLYAALYWAAAGRPAEPWDALIQLLWVGSGLMAIVLWAGLSKLRTQGHSRPTLRLAVLHKPSWWIGWYPRSLRLGHDVWDRLPAGLRIGRATVWWACLLPFLLFGYLLLALGADVQYGLTGRHSFIFTLRSVVNERSLIRGSAGVMPALLFFGMAFVFRFMRQALRDRPKELEELIVKAQFWDTGDRAFWSRPEVESLLVRPPGPPAAQTSTGASTHAPTRTMGEGPRQD